MFLYEMKKLQELLKFSYFHQKLELKQKILVFNLSNEVEKFFVFSNFAAGMY